MDLLCIFVVALLGDVFGGQDWISESEVTVSPGDNITLYCDCKLGTGVYIVWYRNCSHDNQPSLILRSISQKYQWNTELKFSRFKFMRNFSSDTYDLVITNFTDADEGLYFCGTEANEVKDEKHITIKQVHKFGNATRIKLDPREPEPEVTPPISSTCWILLFSLCPLLAAFSSLCSSLLIYHLCRKRGFQSDDQSPDTGGEQSLNKDEDVCYAALDIRQPSQRPKRKKQDSEFSTYSAINTSRM